MHVVDNGELLGEGPGDAEDAEDAQRDGDDSVQGLAPYLFRGLA